MSYHPSLKHGDSSQNMWVPRYGGAGEGFMYAAPTCGTNYDDHRILTIPFKIQHILYLQYPKMPNFSKYSDNCHDIENKIGYKKKLISSQIL